METGGLTEDWIICRSIVASALTDADMLANLDHVAVTVHISLAQSNSNLQRDFQSTTVYDTYLVKHPLTRVCLERVDRPPC